MGVDAPCKQLKKTVGALSARRGEGREGVGLGAAHGLIRPTVVGALSARRGEGKVVEAREGAVAAACQRIGSG